MTRFALLTAGIVLIGVLGFVLDAQSRIPVERPEGQPGPNAIYAPGRVEGATPEIELRFCRLAGRVDGVLAEEGQFVQQGQVLLRLDNRQHYHEVARAAAEVKVAEFQLEYLINGARPQQRNAAAAELQATQAKLEGARRSYERIRGLGQQRAISQQEEDDKRTLVDILTAEENAAKARLELLEAPARADEVDIAKGRIEEAKARLELAKVDLERTELQAPCGGQILRVNVEPGELTGPDSPEPAVILVDTTKMHVRAFVEEMDAPRVKVGMTATITADGLPEHRFRGRVTRLSPCMSRKQLWSDQPTERYDTKTREVWIELEETEALVVGLRVDVVFDPETRAPGPDTRPQSEGLEPGPPSSTELQQPLAHYQLR